MKNRLLAYITAAVMTLGLCACSESDSSSETVSQTTSAVAEPPADITTTAPAEISQPETTTTAPDPSAPYRQEQLISSFDCEDIQKCSQLFSLGEGKLLAVCYDYVDDDTVTALKVVDILQKNVVKELEMQGFVSVCSVGDKIITRTYSDSLFSFYNKDLEHERDLEFDYDTGCFSKDGSTYWFAVCDELVKLDVETGKTEKLELSVDLPVQYVYGLSPDEKNIMIQTLNTVDEGMGSIAEVEVSSGTVKLLTGDAYNVEMGETGMFISGASGEGADASTYMYRIDSDETVKSIVMPEDSYFSAVKGSDILVFNVYDDSEFEGDGENWCIDIMNLAVPDGKGNYSIGAVEMGGVYVMCLTYMPEEKLFAYVQLDDDEKWVVRLIDVTLLEETGSFGTENVDGYLTVDESLLDSYVDLDHTKVGQGFEDLRERADRIEKKYGIKIYMSNQCESYSPTIDFKTTNEEFDKQYEYERIEFSLNGLETSLEKYPEGFFKQFNNILGEPGIRIFLGGHILDETSAAYAIKMGEWYDMVFDINYSMECNFPHEMWHTTESFINERNPELLSDEAWAECNPDGYEYYGMENYFDAPEEYTYFSNGDDWYFYDLYAQVNSFEDKARIMEVIMNPRLYPAEQFIENEHIQRKIGLMCIAVRAAFDTDDWEYVEWESSWHVS